MKKTLNMSFGQAVFHIEEDAYKMLDEYLQSVKRHFALTEGREDIIQDIESRIAEQFVEMERVVLTLADVQTVITTMGTVEDFEGGEESFSSDTKAPGEESRSAPKKLYRNPDDRMIAGVASGLSAYIGVDATWIRLVFLALLFVHGLGLLLYIVFWIVMPQARTRAQKLQMQGSAVNLETITESARADEHVKAAPALLTLPFEILRRCLQFLVPFLRVAIGIFLGIASAVSILALSFAAPFVMVNSLDPYIGFPLLEVISSTQLYVLTNSLYLVLMIPALFVLLLAIGIVRNKNIMRISVVVWLSIVWFIACIAFGVLGFQAATSYRTYVTNSPRFMVVTEEKSLHGSFQNILAERGARVTLRQGEPVSVRVTGYTQDVENQNITLSDGQLTISGADPLQRCLFCPYKPVEVIITAPNLLSLDLREGARLQADMWKTASPLELSAAYGSRATFDWLEAPEVTMLAESGSRIALQGSASGATLTALAGSSIASDDFLVNAATVTAKNGAVLHIAPQATLHATALEGGTVYYTGNPVVTRSVSRGGAVESVNQEEELAE